MRDNEQSITHFVPKSDLVMGDTGVTGMPQARTGLSFYNGLRIPVTIVDRQGIRSKLMMNRGCFNNALIILQEQEYSGTVFLDITDLSDDCGATQSILAKQISEVLATFTQRPLLSFPARRVTIKHTILAEDLQRNGGSVYVPGLDIVISTRDPEFAPLHPFSMVAMRAQLVNADPGLNYRNGLHYQIRIVDRAGAFGGRYINLNGEVFSIPVVDAGNYQDGVYVVSTHPYSTEATFNYARADYYTFEEATKQLSLYLTPVEAATLGDPQSAYKRELEQTKHDLALQEFEFKRKRNREENELETLKRNFEREREEAKRKQAEREEAIRQREEYLEALEREAKIRVEELKRESMVLKDKYENDSMRRKAHMELLKYGPSIVVAGWGIYKAIQKLREKK